MADLVVTKQELIDAQKDAQALDDIVNKGPEVRVKTRLGRYVWTLATLEQRSLLQINEWQNAITLITVNDGVPALAVSDASGKNQQEITSLLANNNLVYRGAKNNQSADISDLFESVANSLNDGDTLTIPEGDYYWDASTGTKVITKNINIDCRGTIHVKPTANAFLRFRTTDFVRGAATSYISAVNKNDTQLNIIGTPLVNPHEYYVIIESTETLIYRAGFAQPYQKYVIADIISSDYDLRDPMPFSYSDLTKATVTFIKKQAPTKISGLKFKPTIEVANAKYLNLDYVSNVTFGDCLADVNGKASAGVIVEYSNCLNLDFIKSGINGQNKAGVDSYAFTIWNSAYINYEKCFNYTSGLSNKSGRLHSGRHGRNVTIDGCLCNGIDDHWGYDYLVKNINFGQTKETYGSIGFAGGSLTVENCHSPDNLVYLRTDTPYADGTLKISGSTAKKSLLFARGHEPSITTFAPQKSWDVVDIDVGVVDFTKSTEPTIIFKEPNVAQTDVYRETILYIRNATRILNKVAGKSLLNIWMQDKADYTGEIPAFEGDYEKKRLFSKVFIENIDTTIIDDASVTFRQYLIQAPVCRELNVRDANDFAFSNVRCPVFNIHNVKTGDSKSGGGSHSLDAGELNATNVREQSGAKTWWFREALYTTPKVYFYTSRFATRDGFISKFGNRLQASVSMVFDDVSVSANTTSDYRSRNNFVRNMTAKYTFTETVTLAANENSAEFEVDFPTVQRADIVLAEFDLWNEYIHIDVYKKNTNGKVYFRLKNNHPTLSKVVDVGRSINFIIY